MKLSLLLLGLSLVAVTHTWPQRGRNSGREVLTALDMILRHMEPDQHDYYRRDDDESGGSGSSGSGSSGSGSSGSGSSGSGSSGSGSSGSGSSGSGSSGSGSSGSGSSGSGSSGSGSSGSGSSGSGSSGSGSSGSGSSGSGSSGSGSSGSGSSGSGSGGDSRSLELSLMDALKRAIYKEETAGITAPVGNVKRRRNGSYPGSSGSGSSGSGSSGSGSSGSGSSGSGSSGSGSSGSGSSGSGSSGSGSSGSGSSGSGSSGSGSSGSGSSGSGSSGSGSSGSGSSGSGSNGGSVQGASIFDVFSPAIKDYIYDTYCIFPVTRQNDGSEPSCPKLAVDIMDLVETLGSLDQQTYEYFVDDFCSEFDDIESPSIYQDLVDHLINDILAQNPDTYDSELSSGFCVNYVPSYQRRKRSDDPNMDDLLWWLMMELDMAGIRCLGNAWCMAK